MTNTNTNSSSFPTVPTVEEITEATAKRYAMLHEIRAELKTARIDRDKTKVRIANGDDVTAKDLHEIRDRIEELELRESAVAGSIDAARAEDTDRVAAKLKELVNAPSPLPDHNVVVREIVRDVAAYARERVEKARVPFDQQAAFFSEVWDKLVVPFWDPRIGHAIELNTRGVHPSKDSSGTRQIVDNSTNTYLKVFPSEVILSGVAGELDFEIKHPGARDKRDAEQQK